jgi:periplasmic protein CpxP/Spy
MKRKSLLVLVPLLAVSFINCRGWKNATPEEKAERAAEFLEYKLDLDESQMITLNRIRQELLVEYKQLRPDRVSMIQEAKKQAAAGTFDTSNLLRLHADNNQKRARVIELMIQKAAELHAVLRPEQRQKLVKLLEKVEKKIIRK